MRFCIVLVLAICIIPSDLSFYLGDLRLTPYRIVLLIAAPISLMRAAQQPRILADYLVVLFSLSVMASIAINQGVSRSIESGGVIVLETMVPYFMARTMLTEIWHFHQVAKLIAVVAAALWILALPESLTGDFFIRGFFRALLAVSEDDLQVEQRLGLWRAMTAFDHPILYGVFCASAIAFAWYLFADQPAVRLMMVIFVAFSTFLSLSTGPWMAAAAQLVLIVWAHLAGRFSAKWTGLIAATAVGLILSGVVTGRNPIIILINHLTLNPQTGWMRVWQWEFGLDNIARRPVFGVGLGAHDIADWAVYSIDSFWLYLGVKFGLIALLSTLAILLLALRALERAEASGASSPLLPAFSVALLGIGLAGLTTHLWQAMHVYWYFLLGSGLSLARVSLAEPVKSTMAAAASWTPECTGRSLVARRRLQRRTPRRLRAS